MVLISQSLPNLVGGVSEQPAVFRRANQCEKSINVYNDPVAGIKKRPGTRLIGELTGLNSGGVYYGEIDRDEIEKYIFTASGDGIRVWDREGNEYTVTAPNGYGYIGGSTALKHVTIGDTTFILNTLATVTADTTTLSPIPPWSNVVFIRQLDYDTTYKVEIVVNGTPYSTSYTTPASGTLSLTTALGALATGMDGFPQVTAASSGLVIVFNTTATFSLIVSSSRGDDYILGIPGEIDNFGDLPATPPADTVVKIVGDPSDPADDHYVRFNTKTWVEAVKPQTPQYLNAATMPHVLTRQSDGSFVFDRFNWSERKVGDLISNPWPSFVGKQINNLFYHRNRLGFLSDINVIFSEAQGINNFFRTTVTTIIDSDPIDISSTGKTVDKLKSAIGVKDGMLLFSEESQFLMNVGDADILSPETASITAISTHQSNTNVDPERIGDSILFATRREKYSGIREYFYQSSRDFTQSASISNHVPTLIPDSIRYITGSSTENIGIFATGSNNTLYVYQFLFNGEEKILSSWCIWTVSSGIIRYAHIFDDQLYLVIDRDGSITLELMPISSHTNREPLSVEICLDENQASNGFVRTLSGGNTTFTYPRKFSSDELTVVSLADQFDLNITRGDRVDPVSIAESGSNTLITLAGDWVNKEILVGTPYDMVYTFSPQYVRAGEGDVEIGGRLQVRNMLLRLENCGSCEFRVDYGINNLVATVNTIDDVVNWDELIDIDTLQELEEFVSTGEIYTLSRAFKEVDFDNKLVLVSHTYCVPVMCENDGYRLTIQSQSYQPVNIAKAQFEALYHKRSRLNG